MTTQAWRMRAAMGLVLAQLSASTALAAADGTPLATVVTKPIVGTTAPKANTWGEIVFADAKSYPWDGQEGSAIAKPPLGKYSKTIFTGPNVGQLIYVVYEPTFDSKMPPEGRSPHYHQFWEWGYTLKGDSVMPEPVSPYQKNGMLYRKKEGGWLSRPPYSLHGGSWATGGLRNQLPYHLIIYEEGDGHLINVGANGGYVGRYGKPPANPSMGDWKAVKEFSRPWLVDSVRDLEWEADTELPGRFVKWLSDDIAQGFRAQLVKVPPGWKSPPEARKTYFENANRMRYMVWGEMRVWQFKSPDDAGRPVKVKEDYFIYQPPRSIWGYGPDSVSDMGAVWLEVTYAKGLTHGGGAIESPKSLR